MPLPPRKKTGDPILAADWNMLIDSINERTPRAGVGLKLMAASGGFSYSANPPMHSDKGQSPFSVIAIKKYGDDFKVTIKEGWVIVRQPKAGVHPAIKFHMPKYGSVPLDTLPRPQLVMADGDSAWCRYTTDSLGEIGWVPEIIVDAEDHDGTHYLPKNPGESAGTDGEFFVKLFTLMLDGTVPTITVHQQSDIEHYAQLWTGENVGYGAGVFQKYDPVDEKYKFRTIKAAPGTCLDVFESGDEVIVTIMSGIAFYLLVHRQLYDTRPVIDSYVNDSGGHVISTYNDQVFFPADATLQHVIRFQNGIAVGYWGGAAPPDYDEGVLKIETTYLEQV
ncbi:MAG: hypothetical protein WCK77_21595 [Verrucomicrobiota bacterium]